MGLECYLWVCMCSVAQSCLTLCDPMDCQSLPESSVHEIFQARIQKSGAISYSRVSFWIRGQTHVLCLLNLQADSLPLSHQGNSEWYRDGFNFLKIISFIFQIDKLCPPKLWNTLSQFELKTGRILAWVEWCRSTFHFFQFPYHQYLTYFLAFNCPKYVFNSLILEAAKLVISFFSFDKFWSINISSPKFFFFLIPL